MENVVFTSLTIPDFRNILRQEVQELRNILQTKEVESEIIDREELCKRLDITETTAITWQNKGKIPALKIGAQYRYNWPAVIKALEIKRR